MSEVVITLFMRLPAAKLEENANLNKHYTEKHFINVCKLSLHYSKVNNFIFWIMSLFLLLIA